jgi:hypothetical protein
MLFVLLRSYYLRSFHSLVVVFMLHPSRWYQSPPRSIGSTRLTKASLLCRRGGQFQLFFHQRRFFPSYDVSEAAGLVVRRAYQLAKEWPFMVYLDRPEPGCSSASKESEWSPSFVVASSQVSQLYERQNMWKFPPRQRHDFLDIIVAIVVTYRPFSPRMPEMGRSWFKWHQQRIYGNWGLTCKSVGLT